MRYYQNDSYNTDGSSASGNWGHIGVHGRRGGSAPGGGVSFRGESSTKTMQKEIGQYCSQAKIRQNIENKLKSKSATVRASAQMQATRYNMEHKSYANVTNYSPTASKDILGDKKASYVSSKLGVKGTKAMRDYTLNNNQQTNKQTQSKSQSTSSSKQTQSTQTQQKAAPKTAQEIFDAPRDEITPSSNPHYQAALQASQSGKAATKQFYDEAKTNGTYNLAKPGQSPNMGDSNSYQNGRVQKLVNYMGLTGKPDVVDKATFDKLAKGREDTVIFRGCSSPVGEKQFKYGDSNRMGGIAYGTGVYFGGSVDGTFKTSCGYGQDIRAMPKKNAKILKVDSMGYDSNGKKWRHNDSYNNTQYTSAIMAGYDAVCIKGAGGRSSSTYNGDYYVLWNRAAFIVEK